MKFYVKRTSQGYILTDDDRSPPCEEAVKDGQDRGIQLYSIEFANLDELVGFAEKYGEIIISKTSSLTIPHNGPEIEIYDDYRE